MTSSPQQPFADVAPTIDSYWRGIVLFGRNVATYKFALAKSLLELGVEQREEVPLEDLAEPFSRHLCEHLRHADRQGTFERSQFLDACRAFNRGELNAEGLRDATVRLGFENVIDAFHVVGNRPVAVRFFEDERRGRIRGIRLTDELLGLVESLGPSDLSAEAEARWRLVETAWSLGLPTHMLAIGYDSDSELLLAPNQVRRKTITPARDALNGYQRGKCFYCFGSIGIKPGGADLAHVDHFFPHVLKRTGLGARINLDGVWNLVLACQRCNAGAGGKWMLLPAPPYLERLHRRNEYLIRSHHPLRETLIQQTGASPGKRAEFLNAVFSEARQTGAGLNLWKTTPRAPTAF